MAWKMSWNWSFVETASAFDDDNKDLFNIFTLSDHVRMSLEDAFPVITVDLVYRQAVKCCR